MDSLPLNSPAILLAVSFVGLTVWLYNIFVKKPNPAPFPPGPKGLPLLGNIADLPTSQPWDTFSKWGEIYGGIVHVRALGQSIIVLNDVQHAVNMLDKRSSIYSDRPTLTMAGTLVGWDNSNVLLPFGDTWKEHRRLFAQFLGTRSKVDAFVDVIQGELHSFLHCILVDPTEWSQHTRGYAGNTALKLVYGYTATDRKDRLVRLVDESIRQFCEMAVTNAFLVDFFPLLRHVPEWLPGAAWKKKVPMYRKTLYDMVNSTYDWVKQQVVAGTAQQSFTSNMLDHQPVTAEDDRIIKWAAASLYSGGVDSVPSTLQYFFLAMTLHTSAQQKAQAELDAVVGIDRLPTPADRVRLPYFEALFCEVLRVYIYGIVPPHVVREDDIYNGYFIPKGAFILTNLKQCSRDPRVYANPEVFSPERFMASEGGVKEADPRDYIFGFGRRICPAKLFADASVWLACASVIATFDIRSPVKDGVPVLPPVRHTDGAIPNPGHFECIIKPRSKAAETVIGAF